jgi:hypothetical protein
MILIDAHVHIHPCFSLDRFFQGAFRNFRLQAKHSSSSSFCLMLTEAHQDNQFDYLKERFIDGQDKSSRHDRYKLQATQEPHSLRVADSGSDGHAMYIIAGRQIVTREGLEVLALGTTFHPPDGLAIVPLIETINLQGGIAVLPWGFGKWLGSRGRVIDTLLAGRPTGAFYVGDNGNRSCWLRPSAHLQQAGRQNIFNLPGSDPLPFPMEASRAGSYGFMIDGSLSEAKPASDLRKLIKNLQHQPQCYGHKQPSLKFMRNQIAMQINKRLKR